tara:strand:+ start:163 stop:471 length:309 start_codon:yes stop_codon:yes gene_type:complete
MTKELCTRTDLAPDETDSSCGEYSDYVDGFTISWERLLEGNPPQLVFCAWVWRTDEPDDVADLFNPEDTIQLTSSEARELESHAYAMNDSCEGWTPEKGLQR